MQDLKNKILEILTPILTERSFFLVDLKINESEKVVRVFIDKIEGIGIQDCVDVSRELEKILNEQFDFSEKYSLEVSSPGLDQEFKVKQQFFQYIGRNVDIITNDGKKNTAVIEKVQEDELEVNIFVPSKSNKKQTIKQLKNILFKDIKSTKPHIKF
jgi:ribosome maturation factor RimP